MCRIKLLINLYFFLLEIQIYKSMIILTQKVKTDKYRYRKERQIDIEKRDRGTQTYKTKRHRDTDTQTKEIYQQRVREKER